MIEGSKKALTCAEYRFWTKVKLDPATGCLEWLGCKTVCGYGQFRYNGKTGSAHRYIMGLPTRKGCDWRVVVHLCRNPGCVNPNHLEIVTHHENTRQSGVLDNTGNISRAKTHCPQGHEYMGDNLYITPSGVRNCRACRKSSSARHKARAKKEKYFA